jgi:hypothetical protein
MKYFIIICIVFSANYAKADLLTTLVVGSMFVNDNQVEQTKTEFELQVEQIQRKLPNINGYSNTEKMIFYVDSLEIMKYKNYFLNKGYVVKIDKDQLVFDFSVEYKNMLYYEKERQKRYEKFSHFVPVIKYFLLFLIITFILTKIGQIIIVSKLENQRVSVVIADKLIKYVLSLRK